ncbi:putative electron transfer flavoprotein subunit [Entophlyctis luteolus]|nr:putative electron transfer flavoprotein subunit [Entophlyctis luteolus]
MASNGVLVPVDHLQLYEFILASNVQPSYEMPSAEAQIPVPPTAATAPPKVQFADQPATTFSLYQQPPEEPVYSHQRQQRQAELPLPAPASLAPPAREANARPQCMNCGTTETSAWRKDCGGRTVCNACGLYKKQRGYDRPAAFPFRKSVVRRRMRVKKTSAHGADAVNAL